MTSTSKNISAIISLPKQILYKNLNFDMVLEIFFQSVILCQSKASGKNYFRFLPEKKSEKRIIL